MGSCVLLAVKSGTVSGHFAHALALERQPVRVVHEPIEDRAGIGHPLVAKGTDRLIRLSTEVLSTPPSPAVRNHRIAVRLALETVSALHRIPHRWTNVNVYVDFMDSIGPYLSRYTALRFPIANGLRLQRSPRT
jgi:hypothetical protein